MKTAIYCRVSTDDQEKEGTSLQTQLEACLKYCQEKGYTVVRKFSETYSGLTLDRPKLTELRNMVQANDLDIIVVYCLDRLSRDPAHGAMLFQELENHHVTLEAVTEVIENTDMGKLISYIRGFASKVEADKIRERTMRGKQARVSEGKLPQGTGIGIYGYNWDKTTGKRLINEYETKIVQKIFTMALSSVSFNKIAIELNNQGIRTKAGSLWYPLTIRRIVSNPTYTGKTYFGMTKRIGKKVIVQPEENWTLLPDITPPIITEEMFKRTQETIANIKQSRPIKKNSPYLLTGFTKCPKCGSPVGGTTMSGKYRYYKCRGSNPTATRGKICDAGYIKADRLDSEVWKKVVEMASSPMTILLRQYEHEFYNQFDPIVSYDKQIESLRKKLKTYPFKEKNLYNLLQHDSVTKEYVLESVDNLKRERLNDEKLLDGLLFSRKQAKQSERFDVKLTEISDLLIKDLQSINVDDSFSNHFKDKRSFLEHIRLELTADRDSYRFCFRLGDIYLNSSQEEKYSKLSSLIKDLEKSHPEINSQDLVNLEYMLPDDTPLASLLNPLKKGLLVTTEQTSA